MPWTEGAEAEGTWDAFTTDPEPPVEAGTLRFVVDPRDVVAEGVGVGVADDVVEPTAFTSTVLLAAALLRVVVRRRGVGEGVAMGKRNGSGTETAEGGRLPIRPDSRNR